MAGGPIEGSAGGGRGAGANGYCPSAFAFSAL